MTSETEKFVERGSVNPGALKPGKLIVKPETNMAFDDISMVASVDCPIKGELETVSKNVFVGDPDNEQQLLRVDCPHFSDRRCCNAEKDAAENNGSTGSTPACAVDERVGQVRDAVDEQLVRIKVRMKVRRPGEPFLTAESFKLY